jgi:octaprenyl-diphosphate synthase
MTELVTSPTNPSATPVLERLESLCKGRQLEDLGDRLGELARFVQADMTRIERGLDPTFGQDEQRAIHKGAGHLVALGGKRLRPMCVLLAAKAGGGVDARAVELAIAVELVHSATLLHDDVVDLGDVRRGAPATRAIWGNAISIFAGDWLLVEALRRVRRTDLSGVLERLLDVIDEMICAESLQLERRGDLASGLDTWWRVAEGKTAALFRWAMFAGGRAGGLDERACRALEAYGTHLGVAFQAIDDVLDLTGDAETTGKALFADLREGKVTYPAMVAMQRDPKVGELLKRAASDEEAGAELFKEIRARMESTGAIAEGKALAEARASEAIQALDALPEGRSREALATVALAVVARRA